VIAGEPKRKENGKIGNLRQEKHEKHGKLLVQLTAPENGRDHRLQDRLRAPQKEDDSMAVPSHGTCRGKNTTR
jgi:hypothetical protein